MNRGSNPRGAASIHRTLVREDTSGDVVKWLNTEVCKTSIHRFESGRRLHFPSTKRAARPVFHASAVSIVPMVDIIDLGDAEDYGTCTACGRRWRKLADGTFALVGRGTAKSRIPDEATAVGVVTIDSERRYLPAERVDAEEHLRAHAVAQHRADIPPLIPALGPSVSRVIHDARAQGLTPVPRPGGRAGHRAPRRPCAERGAGVVLAGRTGRPGVSLPPGCATTPRLSGRTSAASRSRAAHSRRSRAPTRRRTWPCPLVRCVRRTPTRSSAKRPPCRRGSISRCPRRPPRDRRGPIGTRCGWSRRPKQAPTAFGVSADGPTGRLPPWPPRRIVTSATLTRRRAGYWRGPEGFPPSGPGLGRYATPQPVPVGREGLVPH